MNLREWWACLTSVMRFRGYRPQTVSIQSFREWLSQFGPDDRKIVTKLLDHIEFIDERQAIHALVAMNEQLLSRLADAGVSPTKVIYVQVHDAGSSSPAILNLLRDKANLERRGCHFVDSNNVLRLSELTNKLEEGAIVYVDDFAGSGTQFGKVRDFLGEYIIGNFSEFFLVIAACEEAVFSFGKIGVEPVTRFVHGKADRPLHSSSTILPSDEKQRMRAICLEMDEKYGLGYKELASMIVLYRNAPNTLPRLFRGSKDQIHRKGLLPRFDDLPVVPKI